MEGAPSTVISCSSAGRAASDAADTTASVGMYAGVGSKYLYLPLASDEAKISGTLDYID